MVGGPEQFDRQSCSIEFTAPDLEPDAVTALLKRQPDRSFRRGDLSASGHARSQGAWFVSSSSAVYSDQVTDHVVWAGKFLSENRSEIVRVKQSCRANVRLRIFWEFDATISFVLTREMLEQFLSLIDDISFSIV
jgi:hypothetical protein